MTDPFHSSQYGINHAERRLNELDLIVTTFVKSNPCKAVNDRDPRTHENVLKIKLIKPLPEEIPGLVFDILNNLRSALDHAGFATARAAGKTGANAHFPFHDKRAGIVRPRKERKGRSIDIPDAIFKAMLRCRPYERGNGMLWALNKLCNANKHELIIPLAMGGTVISHVLSRNPIDIRFSRKSWNRSNNEREIARAPFGSDFHDNYQVSTYVISIRNERLLASLVVLGTHRLGWSPLVVKYKAYLMDLDGTLAQSEELKANALAYACGEHGGYAEPRYYVEVMGQDWTSVTAHFFSKSSISPNSEAFNATFRERYAPLIEASLLPTPGACEFIENARSVGIKLAVVSSASSWRVDKVLQKLCMLDAFDLIITGQDVPRHKPYPDAYIMALDNLKLCHRDALVFEDSYAGLQAARAARCACIAIQHTYNTLHDLSSAIAVINHLKWEPLSASTIHQDDAPSE